MKNIVTILFLFFSLISQATNYYVKNSGSDAANGLTTATAWATINKVNGSSFSAGDSILFNRGDTWREQLTVPSSGTVGKPITFGVYGIGDNPIIEGSEILSSWTPEVVGAGSIVRESFGTITKDKPIFRYSNESFVGIPLTAVSTYDLTKIEVNLDKVGSPTMIITAYLYSNTAGNPTSLLATSTNTLNASTITNGAWHAFNFDGAFEVQSGTQYWIVLKANGVSSTNYVNWNCLDFGGTLLTDADGVGTWTFASVSTASFKVTGYSDQFTVYYKTSTITNAVWEDNVILKHRLTKNGLIIGSFFWDGVNNRIYIRTSGDDNASGYNIRVAIRENGIYDNNRSFITIDGLHIQNVKSQAIIGYTATATNIIVKNCEINSCGIGMTFFGDHTLVTNNNIHDLDHMVKEDGGAGDYGAEAIVIAASNSEVSYNQITNCRCPSMAFGHDGGFIELYVPAAISTGNKIHHNKITNTDVLIETAGTIENTLLYYNIWINDVGGEIFSLHNLGITYSGFGLYNNTFYHSSPTPTSWLSGMDTGEGDGFILKNNIFYIINYTGFISETDFNHSNNCYYGVHSNLTLGAGEITDDPLFVDRTGGDFHLQSGSPAINAGIDVGLTSDYAGNPIIGIPDIGAYEFGVPSPVFHNGSPIFHNGIIITY